MTEAHGGVTIEAVAVILFSATGTTTLCSGAVLMPTFVAEVALLGYFNGFSVFLGKFQDVAVTLAIVFGHSTQDNGGDFNGDTAVPLLGRRGLFAKMGVPHLFKAFVGKGCTTGQQFVAADGKGVLVGVAARVALPLFGWHIGSSACGFAEGGMGLQAEIEGGAKVREQYLPVASNEQVTRFDILVDESFSMDEVEGIGGLLQVGDKLFGKGGTSSAIFSAEEVIDGLGGVFHDEVGALVVQLAEVVDG